MLHSKTARVTPKSQAQTASAAPLKRYTSSETIKTNPSHATSEDNEPWEVIDRSAADFIYVAIDGDACLVSCK